MHDAQDAEDCLQEVFLRAFRAYGRLDRGSNYRAWLYKIATNTAFNFIKKRNSIAMRETVSDIDRLSDGDSVVNVVETRERLQTVMKVVDELPSKQRSALIMRKYHALPYGEIAQALGSSEAAARANVYQALKKLRERFGEQV